MKRYIKLLPVVAVVAMSLYACYDEKMDWYRDPSWGEIDQSEIPLQLAEKISRYDVLNAYSTYTLGVGISLDLYMNDDTYQALVDENFDEITLGYEMKHAAMVRSGGGIDFTSVDKFMDKLLAAGLTVYGHTLVWHQNQNATYLNGLIGPTVIPGAPGENLLSNGGFEDGLTGWGGWGGTLQLTTENVLVGEYALEVKVLETATAVWAAQVQSELFPMEVGNRYQISFYIKSDAPGAVRISFRTDEMFESQYPPNHASDGADNTISTSATWKQIVYDADHSDIEFIAQSATGQFLFDLGLNPGVTYYIDHVYVVDLDAEGETNYVPNGSFETGDLGDWVAQNSGAGIEVTNEQSTAGSYSVKMTASASSEAAWDLQLHSPDMYVTAGKDYTLSFYIRSEGAGQGRISFPGLASEYPWMNWQGTGASEAFTTSSTWQQISVDLDDLEYAENQISFKLSFDMGYVAGMTYYIDDVSLVEKVSAAGASFLARTSGPIIIEKSDEEKAEIIGEALESWISEMVTHYKADVRAWDVVNEPMDDGSPYNLKTGIGKDLDSDEFYWQDYLGKDYAVTAFNLARQYGNPGDILFINDYNLEYNLNKCDGIIEYVKYIESKGAQVDGIGTQMHISIDTDKDNIAQMFSKLAASGKLIKISELDVQVGTAAPTADQLAEQAEMYQYVVDTYHQYIPEAQRYGITVWGISDHAKEHEYWLPDDAPNLWDSNFARKHAYKGFADGLAGRDVSEDFTGELEY